MDTAAREFHVSRQARDRYQFDSALYSISGNVIFANVGAARLFAQKMNQRRDLVRYPEQTVRAGDLDAMGLIDEILHFVVHLYREQKNSLVLGQALEWLEERLGREQVDQALQRFAESFPPLAVYRGELSLSAYLENRSADVPNRQIVLEEMLMLWLANVNPAFSPFLELFDDDGLEQETVYPRLIASLHDFFDTQPRFGPDDQNLIDMLRAPALASPHALGGQLEFMLKKWGVFLGNYVSLLLRGLDLIHEEERLRFFGPGPAEAPVYDLEKGEFEAERYSPDLEWMPELVLIAKNIYVWMAQLSDKYQTTITRLDQIPDHELDQLARWGFTGLWLIGIWERSPASQRIKQMMGNPEAVASAYSVFDYQVANDLGGAEAMQDLRERARRRGLRLASDMVPNHMAIDSKWLIEHPDWFISLDYSPFPSYSFNGPDLSWDERVGIFLEDHYYSRTDAAVVFKRLDRWTGDEKYIYHGNDGTSFPWNDTAQLDYLNPAVREAIIQTILHVARQFPVIRFDAAMTLAKKHYQRLWFPEPGSGGAIPSRAEHGLTRAQFDEAMPVEFWREVVDRVAAEAPHTLLLAEAFWLMEGYFVRTLGMHRVYNSAFMNMLRDEENSKYRSVIKNTLEFDPEILKRYVNFMNNPDERTAVDQFGKQDKYFGICTMMATLPGLPMFGHGQIEGFAEKYGMEYKRAYWNEEPDADLVRRHEEEIFPLLRRRHLFAGVDNFLLYDLYSPEGHVNEDVFVYSNRVGPAAVPSTAMSECALIAYHNKYATAQGWVRLSAAFSVRTGAGDERQLVQRSLGEGLGLRNDPDYFVIFRDQVSGLEYIRNCRELWDKGLHIELAAYQRNVFTDFNQMPDDDRHLYAQLAAELNGRGVRSIDEALHELALQPVHIPFRELVNPGQFRWLLDHRALDGDAPVDPTVLDEFEGKLLNLLRAIKQFTGGAGDEQQAARDTRNELEAVLQLQTLSQRFPALASPRNRPIVEYLRIDPAKPLFWHTLFGWLVIHRLGQMIHATDPNVQSFIWIDEWLLGRSIAATLRDPALGPAASTDEDAAHAVSIVKFLTSHLCWYELPDGEAKPAFMVLESWLKDDEVLRFLKVNRFEGVVWYNKEAFEELLWWMFVLAVLEISAEPNQPASQAVKRITSACELVNSLRQAEAESGFQLEKLVAAALKLDEKPGVHRPRKTAPQSETKTRRPRAPAGRKPAKKAARKPAKRTRVRQP